MQNISFIQLTVFERKLKLSTIFAMIHDSRELKKNMKSESVVNRRAKKKKNFLLVLGMLVSRRLVDS